MKKIFVALGLIIIAFVSGYYLGRSKPKTFSPVISVRTSDMGLRTEHVDYGQKSVVQFWIPCGFSGSPTGEDIVYFQREIPRSGDELTDLKNALTMLLSSPNSAEQSRGAYRLVPGGRIKDIKFRDSKLTVNFSREFSPGGGSLAVKHARLAVEEVARQFPGVKSIEILVEGRADLLEP